MLRHAAANWPTVPRATNCTVDTSYKWCSCTSAMLHRVGGVRYATASVSLSTSSAIPNRSSSALEVATAICVAFVVFFTGTPRNVPPQLSVMLKREQFVAPKLVKPIS